MVRPRTARPAASIYRPEHESGWGVGITGYRPPCPYRGSPGGGTGPGPVNGVMVGLGRQRGQAWLPGEPRPRRGPPQKTHIVIAITPFMNRNEETTYTPCVPCD